VLLNGPGTFFAALFWVDCITNTAGSDMRQAQRARSSAAFARSPLRFQGGRAFAQNVVEFDDAVFDRAVELAQALVRVSVIA
jgi:hypothetical protein